MRISDWSSDVCSSDLAVTTLYDSFEGERLKGPNDIVFDADGGFWFTDHGQVRDTGRDHGAVFYAAADGSRISRQRADMMGPTGIGLSPDGRTLYVSETMTARVWAIAIVPTGESGEAAGGGRGG